MTAVPAGGSCHSSRILPRVATEPPRRYGAIACAADVKLRIVCARGVAAAVDETDLLWLCEKLVPITKVDMPTTP